MWVKICGNTNLEDAALAAELGADAVGFVFAASKRQVDAEQVAAITRHLPAGLETVGVFDSHNPQQIADMARMAGLTTVQLHGGLDNEMLRQLSRAEAGGPRIIQTLHWALDDEDAAAKVAFQLDRVAALGATDRVLIDSKMGASGGGTGRSFDWAAARTVFASAPGGLRLILAGGLSPDNVTEATEQLAPWGVDLCSGVEALPGRKDPGKLARFLANARTSAKP